MPGFNIKEAVQPGDEVQAMVLRRDDGQGIFFFPERMLRMCLPGTG